MGTIDLTDQWLWNSEVSRFGYALAQRPKDSFIERFESANHAPIAYDEVVHACADLIERFCDPRGNALHDTDLSDEAARGHVGRACASLSTLESPTRSNVCAAANLPFSALYWDRPITNTRLLLRVAIL